MRWMELCARISGSPFPSPQVMRWMEQCAYISGSRLRATNLLIASMDSVTFNAPTKVGHIMYITSQVCVCGGGGGVCISLHQQATPLCICRQATNTPLHMQSGHTPLHVQAGQSMGHTGAVGSS